MKDHLLHRPSDVSCRKATEFLDRCRRNIEEHAPMTMVATMVEGESATASGGRAFGPAEGKAHPDPW
jgi:hypothetical protein